MNVISEKEYSFSNALFWNVMLHHHIRAFDEERDANFDEVWDEELIPTLLDEKKYKKYWCWLSQIDLKTSENQGEIGKDDGYDHNGQGVQHAFREGVKS